MRFKTAAIVAFALAVATTSLAGVDGMALSREGTLYRLVHENDRLELTIHAPLGADQPDQTVPVPQTTGVVPSNLRLELDHLSATVVAVWQEAIDEETSRIMLATYQAGTWLGPVALAGDGGPTAANPALLVHDYSTIDEFETEIRSTYIHLAWWRGGIEDESHAEYAALPLEDGEPLFEELLVEPLLGLFPYGISCNLLERSGSLAHPKLIIDPQTGDPHVLYADLEDCLFGILRIEGELPPLVSGDDEPLDNPKRRRHVVVFGVRKDIAIMPDMPLETTQFEVGFNLSVVAYWDAQASLEYVILDEEGWSEVAALPGAADLSHEQAVALIRSLAR